MFHSRSLTCDLREALELSRLSLRQVRGCGGWQDMDECAGLSLIIASFNGRSVLERALHALVNAAPHAEIIVVDGGSSDGSLELVRKDFPDIRLLEIENYGLGHAYNRGLAVAKQSVRVVMNSDVLLTRAALAAMAHALSEPGVGAVAPVLLNANGSRQWTFGPLYGPNWLRLRQSKRVAWLHGAVLATRWDVLERVGGFDENLFFYNEEFDWCWRLRRAGYALKLLPESVVHLGGASTPANPDFLLEGQRGALYLAHKHAPRFAPFLRLAVCLETGICRYFDPHSARRKMWPRLGRLALRGAFLESPFALSGRGEVHFPTRHSSS